MKALYLENIMRDERGLVKWVINPPPPPPDCSTVRVVCKGVRYSRNNIFSGIRNKSREKRNKSREKGTNHEKKGTNLEEKGANLEKKGTKYEKKNTQRCT